MSDTVEDVKRRIDIVDVVSETVALQRAGRNYRALCPFHAEKTPSFFVFPDRQSWHCFGACATGGDAFSFVMKRNNVDFPEALRILAERAGVPLQRSQPGGRRPPADRLRQANEAAILFYQNALLNTEGGHAALDYMTMRGIDRETAQRFQIGYSPDSWDALREHLKARGFSEAELLGAGLLVEGERGLYDRFRHRLMIPIRDEHSRAVGFGSRILTSAGATAGDDDSPKYLNTPQTPIFDKGAVLYGLERAKEPIRRSDLAVIVEGYMDVIAAHQHENENVVASMGTALTERQVRMLHRYTDNFVLAFDPDEAGQTASERGYELALELGAKIRVIRLASGKDPDELIRASPDNWARLVAEASPVPLERQSRRLQSAGGAAATAKAAARRGEPAAIDSGKSEELCLALLLRYPELRRHGLELAEDLFVVTQNRQVFCRWRDTEEAAALGEALPEELQSHLERIVAKNLPPYDSAAAEEALADCIGRIQRRRLVDAKSAIGVAIAEKEQELGAARLAESAHALMHEGDSQEELAEEDALPASMVVRDMQAGQELHAHPRQSPTESSE